MKKGMTKIIATASASGRYFSAENIIAIPMTCSSVRTNVSHSVLPRRIRGRPVKITIGSNISSWTAKRRKTT